LTSFLDYTQKKEVLDAVSARVELCLKGLGISSNEWHVNIRTYDLEILASSSRQNFVFQINKLLKTLGLSHVGFEHEDLDRCSAARAICATYCALDTAEGEYWAFQDIHEYGPAYDAGIRPGDLFLEVESVAFRPPSHPAFQIPSTPSVLVGTHGDHHLLKQLVIPKPRSKRLLSASKTPPAFSEPKNIVCARTIADGVGYIKISMFPGSIGIDVANAIEKAVDNLGDVSRLVVDLRGNGGGGVGFMRLLDLLADRAYTVGTFFRNPHKANEAPHALETFVFDSVPHNKSRLFPLAARFFLRTLYCKLSHKHLCVRLEIHGGPRRPFHGRVAVLVNRHTASASEMFVACAQEQSLATIVGEPTAGRVRGGTKTRLPHGFQLMLPAGQYQTAHGKTLEGIPISPDVEIAFDPIAAQTGRDLQLERAIEIVSSH